MPLSNKKSTELYRLVSDKITDARIKIARLTNNDTKLGQEIDKILFELQLDASQSAVHIFKPKSTPSV